MVLASDSEEGEDESRASSGAVADGDGAAEGVGQLGDDGQAQSAAAVVSGAGLVEAGEPFEDAGPVFWCHA